MNYFVVITKFEDGVPIPKLKELEVESEDNDVINFYDPVWRSLRKPIKVSKINLNMRRIANTKEGAIKLWKDALIVEIKNRSYALNQLCETLSQEHFPMAEKKEVDDQLFDNPI